MKTIKLYIEGIDKNTEISDRRCVGKKAEYDYMIYPIYHILKKERNGYMFFTLDKNGNFGGDSLISSSDSIRDMIDPHFDFNFEDMIELEVRGNKIEEAINDYIDKHYYIARCFFDYGAGTCLWAKNDKARNSYNYPIDHHLLGLPKEIVDEIDALDLIHNESLDWEYPPNPRVWSKEVENDFDLRFLSLKRNLRCLLKDNWLIDEP